MKELFATRQVAGVFKGVVIRLGAVRSANVLDRFTCGGFPWVPGSRTRALRLKATFISVVPSKGDGLAAKVETTGKSIRLVTDLRLKRAVIKLLTESQESGKDTDGLHSGCCGGFARRR